MRASWMCAGCASHGTPFTFIAALARLGRPHAALASLQARAGPARGSSDASSSTLQGLSLQEAQAALRIRLDCGDVTEAFFEVRCELGALATELQLADGLAHIAMRRHGHCSSMPCT